MHASSARTLWRKQSRSNFNLQDNEEFLCGWIEHIFHVGSGSKFKSIIPAGLIAGGDGGSQGRQTYFFTALDPVEEPENDELHDERESTTTCSLLD